MNDIINLLYVDDKIDRLIKRYLSRVYINAENKDRIVYNEYRFTAQDTYKSLLKNEKMKSANILIIDSWLFENDSEPEARMTGEKIKVIAKYINPFIKIVVISQNDKKSESLTIRKFKVVGQNQDEATEFYDEQLKLILDEFVKNILEERRMLAEIKNDASVDSLLSETIERAIDGMSTYSEFEKEQLDDLIRLFQEVKLAYEQKQ